MAKNEKRITRRANIRDWKYVATISTVTGRLLHIEAGCRHWRTFAAALAHYDPTSPLCNYRWSEKTMRDLKAWLEIGWLNRYACRREATVILLKLRNDVEDAQQRIRDKKKTANKKKKR